MRQTLAAAIRPLAIPIWQKQAPLLLSFVLLAVSSHKIWRLILSVSTFESLPVSKLKPPHDGRADFL